MKKFILVATLLYASPLWAVAQLQNLVLGTPLNQIAGGQYISGTVQVMSDSNTWTYLGIAIDNGSAVAPSAPSFWIAGDSTPPASTPVHSCPSPGWNDGYRQPAGAPVWHTVYLGGWMPYGFINCSSKKYFIVAAQMGGGTFGLDSCGYQAMLAVPFTYNSSTCPTATPTRTATTPPATTPTPTRTATGIVVVGTATPTLTTVVAGTTTNTPTTSLPTAVPTAGPGVGVIAAAPYPNPNPQQIAFNVSGDTDEVKVLLFTTGYTMAGQWTVSHPAAGWNRVPIPLGAVSGGTYYVKVVSYRNGSMTGFKMMTLLLIP